MVRRLPAIALTATLFSILEAAGVSWESQEAPRFRAGVQLVEVDVRVTDADGGAVRNLTRDDFTLLDDGVPQAIATATFMDLTIESPVSRRIPGGIEPDVASNAGSGRMWVMLLGGTGERARRVARQFVNESLGPNDEVAVVLLHGTMRAAQGFTRSRRLLLEAVDRLPADGPILPGREYRVLEDLCRRLGLISGRRKAVIFFDPPTFFSPGVPRRGEADLSGFFFDQRDAIRAAARSNVAVYVVSTEGLTTELSSPLLLAPSGSRTDDPLKGMAGQRVLAEETGGDAIVNSNNFEGGFERFVRDTSQYYLLGYVPTVEHRDGEFHELTVRVNRPGLTVRARPGYYAPSPEDVVPEPPTRAEPGSRPSAATREALRLPLSMNGLTIDLSAAPFRGTDGSASVLLSAQVRGPDLVLGAAETIEVAYQATTTEGSTTPGAFHVVQLDLSERSRASAAASGLRFVDWLALPPGRHQVRFAVHQPNGRAGMVVGDVDVPDFGRAPLSVSGLVLASERLSRQQTLKTDGTLQKVLGAAPTAQRSFVRRDVLTVYAEVYTTTRTPPAIVTASVGRGSNLPRAQAITPRVVVAEPGRAGYVMRVPLERLAPGDYTLSLEARDGRRSATRHVPFNVTAE